MLNVGLIGCGKIAESHAAQIKRIAGCKLVAACDSEELMVRQFCERYDVPGAFKDVGEMLSVARPHVVQITTPPQSHYALARRCLEGGAHVYVEKPLTLYTHEAEELIRFAESKSLKLMVGHDDQFRHAARRMRKLVASGYLGGDPVHMESYYCYEIGDGAYAKALLGDKNHWVRKLPGQLLQNIINHGIARIAEFLKTDNPEVIVHGFVSPLLRSMGEEEIIDELRVIISEEGRTTAYFTFSSQMRPSLHAFRIYGPKNGLMLDQDNETLVKLRGGRYKSYLEQFVPPLTLAKDYFGNFRENVRLFLGRDFHAKAGMKFLIESFFRSIAEGAPMPITYREMLLTSRIMDSIFEQIRAQRRRDLSREEFSPAAPRMQVA